MKNILLSRRVVGWMLRFVVVYILYVAIFALSKAFFLWVQPYSIQSQVSFCELLQAMWHGLPLDLATAGYIVSPIWLCMEISLWLSGCWWLRLYKIYIALVSIVLSLIYVGDACLYRFWNVKIDATVWNYLSQPQGMLQSVSMEFALASVLAIAFISIVLYTLMKLVFIGKHSQKLSPSQQSILAQPLSLKSRIVATCVWMVAGGLMFLGIRGGVGKSTANVGMVYFSNRTLLNHVAVNPAFSLISSSFKTRNFAKEARFFDEAERKRIFNMLGYNTESLHTDNLLNTNRPNVLIVLMEGCGASFVNAVEPTANPNITPNLNRFAKEGVVFTKCYANSYRTDRGTVCTFSGYPSFPDVSVMKVPAVSDHLPSIARSLKENGYTTRFLYGGDINFTNTAGYLRSTGYDLIESQESFPANVRHTHDWGVTDRIMFDTLYHRIMRMPTQKPWHMGVLTLASHEPWRVPYQRIKNDKVANAMAYLDDCVGKFVERFKHTKQWSNTLIVFLPDHGIGFGPITSDVDERKSHIPIIITGGAVKQPREITLLCNQTDLAATLLGQLNIKHDEFRMSRDVLSSSYSHPSAIHTWQEGIYYKDDSGISVINLLTKPESILREYPHASKQRVNAAKAILQTSYNDLEQRLNNKQK